MIGGVASGNPELRRLVIDVRIQAAIGRFFAAKLRSGVLWTMFVQTQEPEAAQAALRCYRAARSAWATGRAGGAGLCGGCVLWSGTLAARPLARPPARDRC